MQEVMDRYKEPHRYYHTGEHIQNMLRSLTDCKFNVDVYEKLRYAILYHDCVYDPRRTDNEEQSVKVWENSIDAKYLDADDVKFISDLIMATKSSYYDKKDLNSFQKLIQYWDTEPFHLDDLNTIIKNFHLISKEYQMYSWVLFIKGHIEFIEGNWKFLGITPDIKNIYLEYVRDYVPKVGIYALSANPFHCGHMSVLEQAEKIFDKVIILYPDDNKERLVEVEDILPFHEVISFKGLLKDEINKLSGNYKNMTLIRGLRNVNDLVYESNLKKNYKDLGMDHDIIYYMTDYPQVSSSTIRAIAADSKDAWKIYIPTKFDYASKIN